MRFPPKTIRGQIVTAFIVCFMFMAVIIGVNYRGFQRLSQSMEFFELAQDFNALISEIRRYEKNYFLYRQAFNYEENVTNTNRLKLMLGREKKTLIETIGRKNYSDFLQYIHEYIRLMDQLHRTQCESTKCMDLQTEIRGVGQNMVALTDHFVVMERRSIDQLLRRMVPLPLISLIVLVILLAVVVFYIGERVIRPLARITREAEAVTQGAFQRITPYGQRGNEIYYLVTAINRMMTELEKKQQQLIQSRKIAAIGTLTAGVAHEINNPVNNISLILESLIDHGPNMSNEEREKLYNDAMEQADRTSDIVKNLLEFSRVGPPRAEKIDLLEIVDKTARLFRNELSLHKINFTKQIETDQQTVFMDRSGLQQVLINLFMNAIHAINHKGEIKVVIKGTAEPGEVRIDVIDTGPGIPQEYIDQVFDPFFTTKKSGVGTGLGLSVSYTVIKKHGGRMEVRSQEGQGACFSIILPLVSSARIEEQNGWIAQG